MHYFLFQTLNNKWTWKRVFILDFWTNSFNIQQTGPAPLPGPQLLYDRKCIEQRLRELTFWQDDTSLTNQSFIITQNMVMARAAIVAVGRASSRRLRHKSRVTWRHVIQGARVTCPSPTSITYQDANYCYLHCKISFCNFLYSSSGSHARDSKPHHVLK